VRIGIDARLYHADRTGIGSYTAHLLQSFARLAPEDEFVLFTDTALSPPGPNFSNAVIKVRKRILWTLLFLPFTLRSHRVELFHGTANFELPPLAPCPLVSTVHDLIPLYFPELVSKKFYLLFRGLIGGALGRSSRVITDSEYSRQDILDRFSIPPEKVTVIPLAPHPRFSADPDPERDRSVREQYGLTGRYLLFVGAFEPRKNIPFLVDAFVSFRHGFEAGGKYQLVLAGGPGYRGREIAGEIRARRLEPAVRLLGYVPDEDLPSLYRGADILVLPSLYEGFGLPALEAMACGTPVLAADSSSLPEIIGPAGKVFSLDGTDPLTESIAALTSSEETLAEMSRQGLEWSARFTWDKTALRTLEVYREVLEKSQGGSR
jgi:glycosyltransferase involved in cell wall biosynthesis